MASYNEYEIRFWNKYYLILNDLDEILRQMPKPKLIGNEYCCMYRSGYRGADQNYYGINIYNPNDNQIKIKAKYENNLMFEILIEPKNDIEIDLTNLVPFDVKLIIISEQIER